MSRPERLEEGRAESGSIQLRTELDPELAEKFRYIKRVLGIRKNSEAVRYLIIEKYERLITARSERR